VQGGVWGGRGGISCGEIVDKPTGMFVADADGLSDKCWSTSSDAKQFDERMIVNAQIATANMPTTNHHVGRIFLGRSPPQMRRIAASAVVARMQRIPGRVSFAVHDCADKPVRFPMAFTDLELPIAKPINLAFPSPASIRKPNIDALPNIVRCYLLSWHT
jgi:hypothetical protein